MTSGLVVVSLQVRYVAELVVDGSNVNLVAGAFVDVECVVV